MRRYLMLPLLLTFACSNAGSGGGTTETPSGIQQRLAEAGVICSSLEAEEEALARESASCEASGEHVTIATFDDDENRDAYLKVARSFGGVWVVGEGWVIGTESSRLADRVLIALGGSLG